MARTNDWKEWSKFVLIELKRLAEEQKNFNKILDKQEQNLREHMRRSDALEAMQVDTNKMVSKFHEELVPIKKKSEIVDSVVRAVVLISKLVGFLSVILGIVYTLMLVIKNS